MRNNDSLILSLGGTTGKFFKDSGLRWVPYSGKIFTPLGTNQVKELENHDHSNEGCHVLIAGSNDSSFQRRQVLLLYTDTRQESGFTISTFTITQAMRYSISTWTNGPYGNGGLHKDGVGDASFQSWSLDSLPRCSHAPNSKGTYSKLI
ncbi:hypothetical protein Tco_0396069 [Tanacetum coccineum]